MVPPPSSEPSASLPLTGYEVVVCVSGGIAAYKIAALVSKLVQDGCGVTVAMTRNARRFVGPATFRALTRRAVLTSMWRWEETGAFLHLEPGEAADLVVVAPATANIIGKLAGGVADELVSTLLLGAAGPVMLAPAMNTRMWRHPSVQRNVTYLKENGFVLVGPEEGWLACGEPGPGRMAEPETIFAAIRGQLVSKPSKVARAGGSATG